MPWHRWLESLDGQDARIGTTRRGIGPAYQDKAGRVGLRMGELIDPHDLATEDRGAGRPADRDCIAAPGQALPQPIGRRGAGSGPRPTPRPPSGSGPFVADTVRCCTGALERDERILCEGAQGTFLDFDLGTYPFVTSSTTVSAGASTGLGLPPASLRKVVGVCKAYTTRVGEGPFPAELAGEEAEDAPPPGSRVRGDDRPATTGRLARPGPVAAGGPDQRGDRALS